MRGRLASERNRSMIQGAIGLLLVVALVAVGIKASFGAFDGGYEVEGTFAAAGQGLLEGSSVAIRGVNVGEVADIELVDNRAVVTLRIEDGIRIPERAAAVIRPKTLFGEKYVDIDPGDDELTGPFLGDGGVIENTLGGFELEQVLADAYPVLKAIDPAELAVVLDELATAGDGLGGNINRSIVNGQVLADLQAGNDSQIRQFLSDLALLSEEIDQLAPDLVTGARDLNVALPSLNARGDQLNAALTELAGLSSDVADLLDANRQFTEDVLTKGSVALQTVYDRRGQIQPLLLGIQQYTQTLAEAIRIEVGDGTMMAAVKNLVSVQQILDDNGGPQLPDLPQLPPIPPLPLDGNQLLPPLDDTVRNTLDGLGGIVGGVTGDRDRPTRDPDGGLLDLLLGGGDR